MQILTLAFNLPRFFVPESRGAGRLIPDSAFAVLHLIETSNYQAILITERNNFVKWKKKGLICLNTAQAY